MVKIQLWGYIEFCLPLIFGKEIWPHRASASLSVKWD